MLKLAPAPPVPTLPLAEFSARACRISKRTQQRATLTRSISCLLSECGRITRDPATLVQARGIVVELSDSRGRWEGETLVVETTTARIRMNTVALPLLEYACHEGNHGLAGSLAAARSEEKAARGRISK